MSVFTLSKNSYFICSDNRRIVRVLDYQVELDNVTSDSRARVEYPAVVGPGQAYSALEVFGVVIQGSRLRELAGDLKDSRCITNREGYCILNNTSAAVEGLPVVLGRQYLRLNDLFIWSRYGVRPTITTVWNRRDQYNNKTLVNYRELQDRLGRSERSLQQKKGELEECGSRLTKQGKEGRKREKELREKDARELEEMKEEMKELEAELKQAKKELLECKKSSRGRSEAMEEEMQELSEELEYTKRKLRECKETLKDRDEELAELVDELRAKDEEIKELADALDGLTFS